jgi:hypothetical protein
MTGKQKLIAAGMLISLTTLLLSCVEKTETTEQYYNIDSLVKTQINVLSGVHATLVKEARLGDSIVTTVLIPRDTSLWATELDEFRQLKMINKPTYKGAYVVQDGLQDLRSNLTVKSFVSNKKLPIEYFKLYYQDTPSKLKRLEAFYQEHNSLYKSSRILIMEFHDLYNKSILSSYSITGGQKMFLGDSVEFSIKGKIKVN